MTLPSSGAISLEQAAAEFGVSLPCVFPNNFWGKPGMPASGALVFPNDFWGKSNVNFSPDGGSVEGTYEATLLCNVSAVWTYSGGGPLSYASLSSGGAGTSITFYTNSTFSRTWSVTGTSGGVSRNFTVLLLPSGGA